MFFVAPYKDRQRDNPMATEEEEDQVQTKKDSKSKRKLVVRHV
jgi:hypothetical protein